MPGNAAHEFRPTHEAFDPLEPDESADPVEEASVFKL